MLELTEEIVMNIYGLEMIVAIPMGGYNASATLQMGMLGSINQMSQLLGTCLLQSRSDNLLHPHLQQFGIKKNKNKTDQAPTRINTFIQPQ